MIHTILPYMGKPLKSFDLVDEMQWEDNTEFISLEDAGLENKDIDTVPAILNKEYFRYES